MEEYNQMQDEYRDRSKDRIQRQLKYGTINATNKTNSVFYVVTSGLTIHIAH